VSVFLGTDHSHIHKEPKYAEYLKKRSDAITKGGFEYFLNTGIPDFVLKYIGNIDIDKDVESLINSKHDFDDFMSQLKNTAKIYNNKIFLGKDDSVLHQRKTNKRDFEILLKNSFFLNFVLSFF